MCLVLDCGFVLKSGSWILAGSCSIVAPGSRSLAGLRWELRLIGCSERSGNHRQPESNRDEQPIRIQHHAYAFHSKTRQVTQTPSTGVTPNMSLCHY